MPKLVEVLRDEIVRLARKEIRTHIAPAVKAAAHLRTQLAQARSRIDQLERQVRKQARAAGTPASAPVPESEGPQIRFGAKGFASQRKRLKLSAHDMGLLLGVSGASVYAWESGKARPQRRQLEAIAGVRKMTPASARELIEVLARQAAVKSGRPARARRRAAPER